jgi:hypothetical protein
MEYVIAYRRVDTHVASWWCDDRSTKGITSKTSSWEDFKPFLCTRFVEKSVESDKAVVPEVQVKFDGDDTPLRGMSIQLHKLSNDDMGMKEVKPNFRTPPR